MINNKDKRYKLETTNWTGRQYARRNIVLGSEYDKLDLLFLVCATIGSSGRRWTMLDMGTLDINMCHEPPPGTQNSTVRGMGRTRAILGRTR